MSENPSVPQDRPPLENESPHDENVSKLSTVMVTNIVLLVIVAVASAVILMFGDFEGKVIRTITTLILFGVFTAFAAFDSTRKAPPRYMMLSQIGHMYMLALSLILIWGSLLEKRNYFDDFSILTKTVFIMALVKAGIIAVQRISDSIYAPQQQTSLVAKFCVGLFALTAVLLTLPLGTDFIVTYGDAYWKFTVVIVIFAALSISLTLLLSWYFGNNSSVKLRRAETRDEARPASMEATPRSETRQDQSQPLAVTEPAPGHRPAVNAQPPASGYHPTGAPPNYAPPVAGPQPWPVFPNGQPLPAKQNGRPDFAVLQYVASVHAEAERQWFS